MKNIKHILLILAIFVSFLSQVSSQAPTVEAIEGESGSFTVRLNFPENPANTNVILSNNAINIFVPENMAITGINGSWSSGQFFANDLVSGACPNTPANLGFFSVNSGDRITVGNVASGGTFDLFSFTTNLTPPQVVQSSTTCGATITLSRTQIDADNSGTFVGQALEGNSTILPVELVLFQAKEAGDFNSELSWITASEINNDFFDVERSADGRVFEKIGKVKGNGTTTETQNYEFIDREPFPGLNYYRLKQVDYNGDYEYSKVETVDFRSGTEGDVAIFPNPAVDYVNISLDRSYDGIRVTNSLGQLVEVLPAQLYESNQFRLDLTGYAPGVYFLEAKLGLEIVNKQFVKIK